MTWWLYLIWFFDGVCFGFWAVTFRRIRRKRKAKLAKMKEQIIAAGAMIVPGSDFKQADSGLWVPPTAPTEKQWNPTFLPDSAYVAAVAEVKELFEKGDFSLPNATKFIPGFKAPVNYYSYTVKSKGVVEQLGELFPGVWEQAMSPCKCKPSTWGMEQGISDIIVHLNDHHKWTREKIADWLDTLEGVDLTIKAASKGD